MLVVPVAQSAPPTVAYAPTIPFTFAVPVVATPEARFSVAPAVRVSVPSPRVDVPDPRVTSEAPTEIVDEVTVCAKLPPERSIVPPPKTNVFPNLSLLFVA